ncbi:hypothetical protein QTP70_025664 [Hemibagrus guttatus]|uniref:Uncharacterized protein n=1 Tax=Hemibagrus guttatus TaxID=175788 RepID=A0AAE0R2J0_9TELE|nr:hypothetical protein QTP70_025664 [Hemibagrus guttatus]KAK3566078.1 hypothetical protein QTP86_025542 [Hemibagrus guttatus]
MPPKILNNFYSCVIESVLTNCITVWYGSTTMRDRKHLQRVVKTAEKIIRAPLPSLQTIYHCRVHRSAASILKDPTHPQHGLFTLLPSGWRRFLQLFQRDPEASPGHPRDIDSLPWDLFPVGHARNTSPGRRPGGIRNRCGGAVAPPG